MMENFTKQDIRNIVDEGIEYNKTIKTLKSDVKILKSDVKILKSDVKTLKSDVKTLKSDVKILKSDVKRLKGDMFEVKEQGHKNAIMLEAVHDEVKLIAEAVMPLLRQSEKYANLDERVEGNSNNIKIITANLKSHMHDKSLHK